MAIHNFQTKKEKRSRKKRKTRCKNFKEGMSALQNKQKKRKNILPFVTEYRPSVPNRKNILMSKWHLIETQPLLREIFKHPPILSYRKRRSLKKRTRKSKSLKVIFFLPRPIGAVFGLSSLFTIIWIIDDTYAVSTLIVFSTFPHQRFLFHNLKVTDLFRRLSKRKKEQCSKICSPASDIAPSGCHAISEIKLLPGVTLT